MDLGDSHAADKAMLERVLGHREYHGPVCGCDSCLGKPPKRLDGIHIHDFIEILSIALWRAAQEGRDLRIAQIIGNLGDCYYMEDAEYVTFVRDHFKTFGLLS